MDANSEANLYQAYEKRQHDATRQRPILPVTIITGSLGAGKTTLLRKILRSKHNLRIAAVVNEYGTVDHDGGVLERDGYTDGVEKLAGGCVCCQGSLGDELEDKVGELLRRPDHADDRYDYLVIETSGVSNPESIVRALDKTFGKLTRARLDSVVTVVDTDALLHQLDENGPGGGMMVSSKRQLESADVVLLNKSDLISPQGMEKVTAAVLAVNPSARVQSCSYGQVPLHAVLDVEAPRTDIQGVSHEVPMAVAGGVVARQSCRTDTCGMMGWNRFQDWVCYGMPAGVVRVKGILAFDEDRLTRSVFNMSGRRRLAFESDGKWEGPMSLYLVVIGVGMDLPGISAALEGMRVKSSVDRVNGHVSATASLAASDNKQQESEEQVNRLMELLAADPMFDAVPREAQPGCAPNVVRFRFTGQGVYGIPPAQLCLKFGVNLDAINWAVLRAVNNNTTTTTNNPISDPEAKKSRVFLTSQEGVHVGDGLFLMKLRYGGLFSLELEFVEGKARGGRVGVGLRGGGRGGWEGGKLEGGRWGGGRGGDGVGVVWSRQPGK
eukprot:jgi/Undpi1/12538/HiC_scaffold_6.g02207.m1